MNTRYIITSTQAGLRLDTVVAELARRSRSQALSLIKAGHVQVNSTLEKPSYLVQAGDALLVTIPAPSQAETQHPVPDLPIIYEDNDLLVIDKPAGLNTHPGNGPVLPSVADFARPRTSDPDPNRPGIVHRLDQDTSGLLIIAKHPEAKAWLQDQFRKHQVKKTYLLLAVGRVEPDQATISMPVGRDPAHPTRQRVLTGGRPASTTYRVRAYYPGYSYIEAHPLHGRTHQLRVHFAAIGHPIAGDAVYGPSKRPLGLSRHFLHATQLEFTGPSGKLLTLTSPLPPDLAQVIQALDQTA